MIKERYLTKNDCYKSGRKRSRTLGIMLHDTAVSGVSAEAFAKSWDVARPGGRQVCVHAFVDDKCLVETLPTSLRCWGCGSGSKGSGNDTYIQIEICVPKSVSINNKTWKYECKDKDAAEEYINKVIENIAEYAEKLFTSYGIEVVDDISVTTHADGHKAGIASNHGDPYGLLNSIGKDIGYIRKRIERGLRIARGQQTKESSEAGFKSYVVRVKTDVLNVRSKPTDKSTITGKIKDRGCYTIVKEEGTWGKLKSGLGWIYLGLTERV